MSTKAAARQKNETITPAQQSWESTLHQIRMDRLNIDQIIELADQLNKAGDTARVDQAYALWIETSKSPLKFVACFNYGVMLANWNRDDDAIRIYKLAIEINPGFAQPRVNLGLALERKGLQEEAVHEWRQVVDDPRVADASVVEMKTTALNHVGRLREIQRNYDAAENALTESLALNPNQTDALHHWFHLRQKQCKWPAVKEIHKVTKNQIICAMSPLACLAHSDDPVFQMFVGNRIVREKFTFPLAPLTDGKKYGHKKIRIGYLSGDLCTHAVGLILPEIFEQHDRNQFEIYAYDYSREDGTPLRQRYKTVIENFVSISAMTDLQAAQKIRQDEIDILVDLHGLSLGIRAGILAQRPATIQMTYLGYIGTTMMPYIDYVITDKFCLPEEQRTYYSEKPLYLDRCCLPTDRKRVIDALPTKESVGLPTDKFIYATFNNAYKLNPDMFACWMRILKRVPESVLWIVDDNPWATQNLKDNAQANGVDPSRLIFTPRVHTSSYLARMELVDVFLDNHPYNAGSTASDIMWMGTAMVTLAGKTFVSRMAGSMLHHCGLEGLIAHNHAHYEELAVTLSTRKDILQNVRARLHAQRQPGGAFDMTEFTRNLESKYLDTVRQIV